MTVNGATTNYTYNALDQLTSTGAVTYNYDARGNQIKITNGSNITNYTYNSADQLIGVTAPGISASYAYDADGRRVKQTLGSAVTNYLWDEASAYGDVVYEYNGSGATLASYVLGGTETISQTRGATTSYFLQDGQNSTHALTSSTGAVTDTYSYTAFGESYASSDTTVNPYRYTGQQFDSATGLYDLRARYYNPALGRFLSGDKYPVNFGNPRELNRYVYAANSPINLSDPTGNAALAEYSLLIGTVGGGVAGGLQAYACGGSPSSIMQGAFLGAMMGLTFASGALVYPAFTLAAGMGLSAYGAVTSYNDMWQNGVNGCNTFSLGMSLLGIASGAWGMGKGMGGLCWLLDPSARFFGI